MPELTPIQHVDVVVHLDCIRAMGHGGQNPEDELRFQKCLARMEALAEDPGYIVLYLSSFEGTDPNQQNEVAKTKDLARIDRYNIKLGPRFFLFPELAQPNSEQLNRLFQERGFTYHPRITTLRAYGEFLDACVGIWFRNIRDSLGLQPYNCQVDEGLSLHSKSLISPHHTSRVCYFAPRNFWIKSFK